MPTKSSKARSPSPDSSGRILCIDDRSLSFSNNRHYPSHNKTYSISERPLPERLRLVAQIVLVPLRRRRHESTNRAGHLWDKPGDDNKYQLVPASWGVACTACRATDRAAALGWGAGFSGPCVVAASLKP